MGLVREQVQALLVRERGQMDRPLVGREQQVRVLRQRDQHLQQGLARQGLPVLEQRVQPERLQRDQRPQEQQALARRVQPGPQVHHL